MLREDNELIERAGLSKTTLAKLLGIRLESVYKWQTLPRNVRLLLEERIKRREAEDAFRYTLETLKTATEE